MTTSKQEKEKDVEAKRASREIDAKMQARKAKVGELLGGNLERKTKRGCQLTAP